MDNPQPRRGIENPSPAGLYDAAHGGTDNYSPDRRIVGDFLTKWPLAATNAASNRSWMRRAVSYLAGEAGITQFLDLGCGKLTDGQNVHQVARGFDSGARVAYFDSDPTVRSHALAELGEDAGVTFGEVDVRDSDVVLGQAREVLDFTLPVAVLLITTLHYLPDVDDPAGLVRRYLDAVPAGSFLAVSHGSADGASQGYLADQAKAFKGGFYARPMAWIGGLLDGLEVVEPGLVDVRAWRPTETEQYGHMPLMAALGRKPVRS
jgi:hypothetical protein